MTPLYYEVLVSRVLGAKYLQRGEAMARSPKRSKHTILSSAELAPNQRALPKSQHGHPFARDRVPPGFHTIVDPEKNPPQPWRDLPPAPGLPPYRMSLETILDPVTL